MLAHREMVVVLIGTWSNGPDSRIESGPSCRDLREKSGLHSYDIADNMGVRLSGVSLDELRGTCRR